MRVLAMNKTNLFIAVAIINIVVIAGIIQELGINNDEVDTSTIVTASLTIKYSNAGPNGNTSVSSIGQHSVSTLM